jgi:hypothetical protein
MIGSDTIYTYLDNSYIKSESIYDYSINQYVFDQFNSYGCALPFSNVTNTSPSYKFEIKTIFGNPFLIISWLNLESEIISCKTPPPSKTLDLNAGSTNKDSISLNVSINVTPLYGYHSKVFMNLTIPSNFGKLFFLHHHTRNSFADPFELSRISFKNLNVSVFGHVDLELPAHSHLSKDHFVVSTLHGSKHVNVGISLELPFHLRYQKVLKIQYADIEINQPYLIKVIESDE